MKKMKNEAGSVLVFITLMIVILMVMVGMGLDTGMLTYSRSMGQRAVDMAALAGAAGLAKRDITAIQSNIEQLNETNDYVKSSSNQLDGTVNPASGEGKNVTLMRYNFTTKTIESAPVPLSEANAVRVALETTNPYSGENSSSAITTPAFLTPLINLFGGGASASPTNNVNVSAISVLYAQPALPIVLGGCDYPEGTEQNIPFNQAPSGGENPNNSGLTTFLVPATSVPNVTALIRQVRNCQGTGTVGIGTPICMGNGAQIPVLRVLEELVDRTGETCYLAPVVDPILNFTGCTKPITKYAYLCPKAICVPGATVNQDLCASDPGNHRFIASIKSCNVTNLSEPELGECYSLRLVRETKVGM